MIIWVPLAFMGGGLMIGMSLKMYGGNEGPLTFIGTAIFCSPMLISIVLMIRMMFSSIDDA
jgi:hypothetical protein